MPIAYPPFHKSLLLLLFINIVSRKSLKTSDKDRAKDKNMFQKSRISK